MVRWQHWLNGHKCEQTPGDSEGTGSPACCSPWGHKESDIVIEQLILYDPLKPASALNKTRQSQLEIAERSYPSQLSLFNELF